MMRRTQTCSLCGHAVKVVGDTTQHYEPVGCLQLVDDHQLCEQESERLRAALTLACRDGWSDPDGAMASYLKKADKWLAEA